MCLPLNRRLNYLSSTAATLILCVTTTNLIYPRAIHASASHAGTAVPVRRIGAPRSHRAACAFATRLSSQCSAFRPSNLNHSRFGGSSKRSIDPACVWTNDFRCRGTYYRSRGHVFVHSAVRTDETVEETKSETTATLETVGGPDDNTDRKKLQNDLYGDDFVSESNLAILDVSSSNNDKANEEGAIPSEFYPVFALCFFVSLLSALDRVAMSIAILPMATEFGFTETIKGQISSAVSIGYGAVILPIGILVAVLSPRWIMAAGVALWSLATIATPLVAGGAVAGVEAAAVGDFLLPLIAVRAVMGAAEAVVLPTMQRILANWVPPEKKATALATIISGFQMGTVGAYLVSPLIIDRFGGWRGMFYIYGALGFLWLVPWLIFARDAPASIYGAAADEECEETFVNSMFDDDASLVFNECPVNDDVGDSVFEKSYFRDIGSVLQSAPWSTFVTSKGVWAMALAHASKNWGLYNLLAWTPTFYSEQYGLNIKESAIYSILPSICGAIGGLTAGNLADYVLSNGGEDGEDGLDFTQRRTNVRKLFQGIGLLGPAAFLFALSGLPEDVFIAQALLGGIVGLQAFDVAGFGAATQEKAGQKWSGLLYSLTSLPGVIVGSVSVYVTGQILDMTDGSGWPMVFQLNAAICMVGALSFLFLYDSKKEFD